MFVALARASVSLFQRRLHLWFAVLATAACAGSSPTSGATPEVSTSSPHEGALEAVADPTDEQIIFDRVAAERQEREHGALRVANTEPEIQSAIRAIRAGAAPLPVLRTAMERLAEAESAEVQGWMVEAQDLHQASIPSAFLEEEDVTVAVVVIRHRAPELPRYAVIYLLIHEGQRPSLEEGRRPTPRPALG